MRIQISANSFGRANAQLVKARFQLKAQELNNLIQN